MTQGPTSGAVTPLNTIAGQLADALAQDAAGRVRVVRDDERQWLGIDEVSSLQTFAEAEGDELRVTPFLGDVETLRTRSFVKELRPSWVDGEVELLVDVTGLTSYADRGQVIDLLHAALTYWEASMSEPGAPTAQVEPGPAPRPLEEDFQLVEDTDAEPEPGQDSSKVTRSDVHAQLQAAISAQWSWAASSARIPQVSSLAVSLSAELAHARVTVTAADGDVTFGSKVVHDGPMPAGLTVLGGVNVPLAAHYMSQVEDRRGAECEVTLEDARTGEVLSRFDQAVDIQPRDLWLWQGDPRNEEHRGGADPHLLARALLASFVRPNHPEITQVAREAAELLGRATGDSSFGAFQLNDVAAAEERTDATVVAMYKALQARSIAYSDPPPGWDYRDEGQRIRDHGDVARGGLGTCMDTTVLMASVMEQAGLLPVLVLVTGHIFVGYWRRNPLPDQSGTPDWYPATAVVYDPDTIHHLVEGGWLGVIETTTMTAGKDVSAQDARTIARRNVAAALATGYMHVIDVAAARRAGVSPLPAVRQRDDGVVEVVEYRPGGSAVVTDVVEEPQVERERHVDGHPARYRTWKSSLFNLNATNALLNLASNARVQPLMLPPSGLGILEDRLNEDKSFSLLSGYDIPEVWKGRDVLNAIQLFESGEDDDRDDLLKQLGDRRLFVQRIGRSGGRMTALAQATFVKELRSMAANAKTAREERGMNPLFLCLGMLRWSYKPGMLADAPLILVPVNVAVARGRIDFILTLDTSQQTTPNAALLEWLRREHGLSIPNLAEPLTDRAGIDVDGVLAEVRRAIADRGLDLSVSSEARLATLDLSAFRMWQDLNTNADHFFQRPLVKHLVETPTEVFRDPAVVSDGSDEVELEELEAPIPADSTQKRAVLWARQGRTFVLQGPPGTGKSQTITNMVAECLLAGLRVLFVAEKGTALAVVQRRLDAIGLAPFTLNLHHEGSNAAEVRAQLKRALTAQVTPDGLAMESARRKLRNARFQLTQYPEQLHRANAAGLSAYGAHDELLVLQGGPEMSLPPTLVAHQAEQIEALREIFQGLEQWTAAAGVRPGHPYRLAGPGTGDPFEVDDVSHSLRGVLDGNVWARSVIGPLRDALQIITHPVQLARLAAASAPGLPTGEELSRLLESAWPVHAPQTLSACEVSAEGWCQKLHGFSPDVLGRDLRGVAAALEHASASGLIGRKGRVGAALAPLAAVAPPGLDLSPTTARSVLTDLIAVQDAEAQIRASIAGLPGFLGQEPENALAPGAIAPARERLEELGKATQTLRGGDDWTRRAVSLARDGHLVGHADALGDLAGAWQDLTGQLAVGDEDLATWRSGEPLTGAVARVADTWRRDLDYERLVPLQRWCTLVRKLEPMRAGGLNEARVEILEGRMPAHIAEDALARGVARASLAERIATEGLDRFDAVAHDERVTDYSRAQEQVRAQWVTDGPARLLAARGAGGLGSRTGGLARELEKTTRKLGTRPILRKYGEAVQELTPLVLCSPSSVVDLIEPGVMEFDLVIFDEASQITVPEAVGALGRARAAVVVGDSKQMPPTRKIGGGAVDEEVDDPDAEEIVEDQESILSECELARVPTLSLSWHYRSQDEALIAFSNRTYYRGDLSSFPTPTLLSSETGLEFKPVTGPEDNRGMYLRAGSAKVDLGNGIVAGANTNPTEAREIVDYVRDLVHASPKLPSVGIVTFNEQQRQLIEDLLHATGDSRVADVMDDGKMGVGEALFVKALEQVQGDERDMIIFSIAFSKQANGKVPTNFGPLTNAGGERRLNVAVTRARRKNVVFCSFDPSGDLDVAGSTYQGPKDLRQFLIDAKKAGVADHGKDSSQRVAVRDRHRDEIATALRDAGVHVMSDVGLSNFRLDLVLARSDAPERPLLPVLLDGESWRRRNTVSDRDVLPVEVLENLMGWPSVARIWWPMWLQNRDEVVAAILAQVDAASARLDGRAASVSAEEGKPGDIRTLASPVGDDAPSSAAETSEGSEAPGVPQHVRPENLTVPSTPQEAEEWHEQIFDDEPDSHPVPVPAPHAATKSESIASRDPGAITEFVAAHQSQVGSRDVLDRLSDREAADAVRTQVLDVLETEGPVEAGRLARIVARRFGLSAVRSSRADDILKLVPPKQVRRSRLGVFAWPAALDPDTWTGFRLAGPEGSRPLDEVAPQEIANAMALVRIEYTDASDEAVLRRTAEVFGITRLGGNVRSRLEAVMRLPPREPLSSTDPDPLADGQVGWPTPPQQELLSDPGQLPPIVDADVVVSEDPRGADRAPRPPDAVVNALARDAESIRPDFSNVEEHAYYDYRSDRALGPALRSLVNELVLDRDYDGGYNHFDADQRLAGLSAADASSVRYAVSMVWSATVGRSLEGISRRLVTHLAADPEFDPLPWNQGIDEFVTERLAGHRPGLIKLVQQGLNTYAYESGLAAKVEEEIKAHARRALEAMTPIERDIYGFTTRNARRLQLAEPHLTEIRPNRHRAVVYWMSRLEHEETGMVRESRYATAARRLLALGETRAAISRTLGISTSVMDRIQRENRRDVVLLPDDPIITDLVPGPG